MIPAGRGYVLFMGLLLPVLVLIRLVPAMQGLAGPAWQQRRGRTAVDPGEKQVKRPCPGQLADSRC